jgi:hypothetical protein
MRQSFRALSFRLILAAAAALLALPVGIAGQSSAAKPWSLPRTPDGRPDLEGIWLSKTATPLERPKALEGRASLTDEEVATLQARANRMFKEGNSDFAAGDAVFLAALDGRARFSSPTSTHNSEDMIEREFDHHTSLVIDPPDGHIPPITAEARRRREAIGAAAANPDGPEDLGNAFRCLSWGVPRLGGRYGAGDLGFYQIVQTPTHIVLFMETGHEARIIPLDGRPHAPAAAPQWAGDSRGRWDGDSLVVDTVNFSGKANFMGAGENLHLVERFTRVSADTVTYQMTFDDKTTWTRPWTAEMPLKRSAQHLYEYACHEGNFLMTKGVLGAAHARERAQR